MPRGVYSNDRRTAWTAEHATAVEQMLCEGKTCKQIAKKLGRSEVSVQVWIKRNLKVRPLRPLSARSVADLLGLGCSKIVARWCEAGWLRGRRGFRVGGGRRWFIDEDAVWAFIEDPAHWHRWNAERITDPDLREWACGLRTERYLLPSEVASRYVVAPSTVWSWIQSGALPAVRNGNHLVPESALREFVPPYMYDRHGRVRRAFAGDEDLLLLSMRERSAGWTEIGDVFGRHASVVMARWRRLNGVAL